MKLTLSLPWLQADLQCPMQVLSFAPYRSGFVTARRILWRQVRNADLLPDFDAESWLASQIHSDDPPAVAMMTSCDITQFQRASHGPVDCIATVGLGNAERVGHRRVMALAGYGTINIALKIDLGLSQRALIEAQTIAASARTAALIAAHLPLPDGLATGTGTDCIAIAARAGDIAYAGMHTELGEAIGRATFDAVLAGARDWIARHGAGLQGMRPDP